MQEHEKKRFWRNYLLIPERAKYIYASLFTQNRMCYLSSGDTSLYKNAIKWTLNKKHIPYKNLSQEIHSSINNRICDRVCSQSVISLILIKLWCECECDGDAWSTNASHSRKDINPVTVPCITRMFSSSHFNNFFFPLNSSWQFYDYKLKINLINIIF